MSGPAKKKALEERLRAIVLRHAAADTLECEFEPGGQLHGVGIPSPLYCSRCGQMRELHDIAEAVRRLARRPVAPVDRYARLVASVVGRQN